MRRLRRRRRRRILRTTVGLSDWRRRRPYRARSGNKSAHRALGCFDGGDLLHVVAAGRGGGPPTSRRRRSPGRAPRSDALPSRLVPSSFPSVRNFPGAISLVYPPPSSVETGRRRRRFLFTAATIRRTDDGTDGETDRRTDGRR